MEKLIKGTEVAGYLSISRSKAYRMMSCGQIPVVRFGKSVRVRIEDLERFVQNHRESDFLNEKIGVCHE